MHIHKKNLLLIFVFIISFFAQFNNVFSLECQYKDNTLGNITLNIEEDTQGAYTVSGSINKGILTTNTLETYWNSDAKKVKEKCESQIYICYYKRGANDTNNGSVYIDDGQAALDKTLPTKNNCHSIYNEDPNSNGPVCITYQKLLNDVNQDYEKYEKCNNDANCKVNKLKDVNASIDTLKTSCRTILSQSHSDSPCAKLCINFQDDINKMKKIYKVSTDTECGVAEEIIVWIANIVRWMKYIVPVIAIILGIIDFIRAMASDKDDEMKKAQGRFLKRVLAAALIFLVPIIIEFILHIFGFDANGCGVIDL